MRGKNQKLKLLYSRDHEQAAQLVLEQCGAIGLKVELVIADGDVISAAATADWDMAIAPIGVAGDISCSYARLFSVGENGATWFNFSRNDVLYVAATVATVAGHYESNLSMLETWLRENPVVLGLYTPGSICLVAYSAGEVTWGENGIVVGALTPKE